MAKTFFEKAGIGCIASGIGLSVFVVVIFFAIFGRFFREGSRIIDKTIDADNVIYNYEWFKQRHQDVQAIDTKIEQANQAVNQFKDDNGERSGWDMFDKQEYDRLNSVAIGLQQQRADIVAEYNARSRMANRSIFKAGDTELPETIN